MNLSCSRGPISRAAPAPALAVLAAAVLIAACAPNASAGAARTRVVGDARVIDGMTLEIAGIVVRLYGIDAPDLAQTCERRGRTIPCGNVSRTALMDLVAGAKVTCKPVAGGPTASNPKNLPPGNVSPGNTMIATCSAGGFDIGNNMVHTGWALADPKTAPRRYRATGTKARARKVGLWRMKFELPWEWRGKSRAGPAGSEICVRGLLTGEDAECPALRDAEGVLFTIAKRDIGRRPGQDICVCGHLAEMSICMQGKTLTPSHIGPASDCPQY